MHERIGIDVGELTPAETAPQEPRLEEPQNEPRRIDNLTLVDGKSFFAATVAGDITPPGSADAGLFRQDTRFLSRLELRVNGRRAVVLSACSPQNIAAQSELTASSGEARDTLDMPDSAIHIRREQLLAGHLYDRLCFENYNLKSADIEVEFKLDADFKDVFQVRGMPRDVSGEYFEPLVREGAMVFAYLGRDGILRQTWVAFEPPPQQLEPGRACYRFRLAPREQHVLGLVVSTQSEPYPAELPGVPSAEEATRQSADDEPAKSLGAGPRRDLSAEAARSKQSADAGSGADRAYPTVRDRARATEDKAVRSVSPRPGRLAGRRLTLDGDLSMSGYAAALEARRDQYRRWASTTTEFTSSNEMFNQCLATAMSDFFSLRVTFDGGEVDAGASRDAGSAAGERGEIIAAGIPWFATVFGRDSLIAGYQSLALHPNLARATLRFLAGRQGRETDDWRDEDPGKILHELREGEMTRTGETPHSPYYGSLDSTPLFLILLDETYAWTGDDALLDELMPAADRALDWIAQYGDLDGDGLVEYQTRSSRGLTNQAWKDSWDAYLHKDGTPLATPIAPLEVQGYCYDALRRMARLLRSRGRAEQAESLRRRAQRLAQNIEQAFWLPAEHYYAMALDAQKCPLAAIASNAGHLLWSRVPGLERARRVANRLLRSDMYSGWGVRTLSADEPTFNPLSYHRGSVWPHDNSLIAQGCAFYGLQPAVERIFTGLFQTAGYLRDQRLPELWVGVPRGGFDRPVNYPVSCSPQAWASGAWFLLLTAALGLRPQAAHRELRVVNPMLPEWLNWLRIERLRVGQSQVSLEFSRRGTRTFCNVLDVQGERLAVSVDFTAADGRR